MKRKAVVTLVLVVILLSGLFACSKETTETEPSQIPTSEPSQIPTTEPSPTPTPEPSPTPTPTEEEDLTDLDMDGVPDQYEVAGFVWKDNKFQKWDGNPNVTYYRTDPTQFSTDQDPYSDGMEVSGIKMDTSVAAPGNHPLVPAYPDIYVSMTSYDVTTRGEITNSSGGQTQDAWSNSVTDEKTMEHHWEFTVSSEATVGTSGMSATTSWSATVGGRYGSNHAVTESTSGFSSEDWQEAMTTNPSEAAELKLRLKFENHGTAAGENVIPTVSLMLGDKTIATYQLPEDKKIDVLPVNSSFPEASEWVIGDEAEDEIIVTLDELKSIQMGAPLFLDVPQIKADVLEQDEQGHWQVVDTWANYKARVDSVCARLSVDLRNGSMNSYRVFAKSQYGPEVTLKDALDWTVGYKDTGQGPEIMGTSVKNWRFGFSENAIEDVTRQLEGQANNNLLNVVLDAGWTISIMAPSGKDIPEIVWCYANEELDTTTVTASVIDDFAVSRVIFRPTPDAEAQFMTEETKGSGIYKIQISNYSPTGRETIEAINDRGNSAKKSVSMMLSAPLADGSYVITSRYSNKSIAVENMSDDDQANVVQYQHTEDSAAVWQLQYIGSGYYRIINEHSGKCLEVADAREDENVNVRQNTWSNSDNQKWRLEDTGDGYYSINAMHSRKCLDVETSLDDGANIRQHTYEGGETQQWVFESPEKYPSVLSDYYAIAAKNSTMGLDVLGANIDDGAIVGQWDYVGGNNQQWQFRPVGEGFFEIVAKHSEKLLGATGASVVQQTRNNEDSQKWRFESVEGGAYYKITNKGNNQCLSFEGSITDSEINLVLSEYAGKDNQKWVLHPKVISCIDLIRVIQESMPCPSGYKKINFNLNTNASKSRPVYICIKENVLGSNNFKVVGAWNNSNVSCGSGWVKIPQDLNEGTYSGLPGIHYNIYLCVKQQTLGVYSISAISGGSDLKAPAGWTQITYNLNHCAVGGVYVNFIVK